MHRTSFKLCALGCLGVAALIGCAEGTDAELGIAELATEAIDAGNEASSAILPPSTRPTAAPEDAGNDDDAATGAADAGTKADAAPDAGGTGGPVGGTGGPACASPNTCAGGTDLGTISGDTGSGVKTAQGSGSQWLKIRLTEDDSDVFGLSMLVKAELVSPPGTNFDVHVYVGGSSSAVECSSIKASGTSTGTSDTAKAEWGEGTLSNGSSDDRNVTVEVRWVSGTCSPTAKWSLTVRGNAP